MAQDLDLTAVTDSGKAAMQEALDNGYTMVFQRLVTGNGTYEAGEVVKTRTALKSQKNTYSFSSIAKEADGVTLKAAITNQDGGSALVEETYNINEIGIYVSVNGTETLYAIAAVGGGTGMELPAFDGDNAIQIVREWFIANSNEVEINIDLSGAYAMAEDLADETEARIRADFKNLYGVGSKTAVIGENQQGNTVITETDTETGIIAVSTIVEDTIAEQGAAYPRTTITTIITTDEYIYTKTEIIIERDETTDTISYTKEAVTS